MASLLTTDVMNLLVSFSGVYMPTAFNNLAGNVQCIIEWFHGCLPSYLPALPE